MLCDRLGIFINGQLVVIGAPKELTARHGGHFILLITTPESHQKAAETMVREMSPHAKKVYALAGTQKFELPGEDVTLAKVFDTMGSGAEKGIKILDWGIHNVSLEDVFIKFALKK